MESDIPTLCNQMAPVDLYFCITPIGLSFVQQLADGTVRLSFDQFRFRTPLDYHQPRLQSPILLRDRLASQCSSSKPPLPPRKNLDLELQGVKIKSQVTTPCYTAKQDSTAVQDDHNNQNTPSPTRSDFEQPEPPVKPKGG